MTNKVIAVRQGPGKSVVKAGVRGRPGPTVSAMTVDDDGYLIITLEDGTVITSPEPLNRPWGTIVGDITTQLDLMGLLNAKTDLNDFLAFVQQTVADLAARYTKDEADGLLAGKVDQADQTRDIATLIGAISYNADLLGQALRATADIPPVELAIQHLLAQASYNVDLIGQLSKTISGETVSLKSLSVVGLSVLANTVRIRDSRTPAASGAAGSAGEVCWDSNYIYVCVATNTWKRSTLNAW